MAERNFDECAIVLRVSDQVAVLKRTVKAGDELRGARSLRVRQTIGAGHKIALVDIAEGQAITKYGQTIGFASTSIGAGDHVHTHNVVMRDFGRDYAFCVDARPVEFYPAEQRRCFDGFARPNGRVGTRNYLAVISSVNCSASVSHYVRDRFRTAEFQRDFPNVDGVIAFTHKAGCAMDPGEPQRVLQRVLAGVARHPNISGKCYVVYACPL